MHFKKTLFFSFGALLTVLAALIYTILYQPQKVVEEPIKLDLMQSASQIKEGTLKTLLLKEGDQRKIGTLKSHFSTLHFTETEKGRELLEEMQEVDLIFQEELLIGDEQVVLVLKGESATYSYEQEKLVAKNVTLSRYKLKGHAFPSQVLLKTPFFQGTAARVSVVFSSDKPTLNVEKLKASFSS